MTERPSGFDREYQKDREKNAQRLERRVLSFGETHAHLWDILNEETAPFTVTGNISETQVKTYTITTEDAAKMLLLSKHFYEQVQEVQGQEKATGVLQQLRKIRNGIMGYIT